MIENDRWYKRLGWFIFYFLIMLLIFFIIDLFVQKYIIHYNEAGIEASYEKEVYELMINGFNYVDIAAILNKSPKQVDNAIQRIRNKLKGIL